MAEIRQAWGERTGAAAERGTAAELGTGAESASRTRLRRRIAEVQRSLKLAEAKVARCKASLEALTLSLKAEEPTPWADFRIRLHVGKLWLRDLEHKAELALAARAALASRCTAQERSLLFDSPVSEEKQHLQRALKCGTLLCSRAEGQAACQTLLLTYLNTSPRLLRLRC